MRERRTPDEIVLERRRTPRVPLRVARLARRKDDSPGFAAAFGNLEEPAQGGIAALADQSWRRS